MNNDNANKIARYPLFFLHEKYLKMLVMTKYHKNNKIRIICSVFNRKSKNTILQLKCQ